MIPIKQGLAKKPSKVSFKDELRKHLQDMVLGGKFKSDKLHSIPKPLHLNSALGMTVFKHLASGAPPMKLNINKGTV